MKDIALTINGRKINCPPGTSILGAAEANAITVPTLCSHADLAPYGACRICLVEDENTGRLLASCVTPVAPDMTINTDSQRVIENRKNIIRLMIAEHPESCIVCNKGNRCELRRIAASLGIGETKLYPMPNYKPFETFNPFIIRDLSKCILCGKCIRADHELVGIGAIDYSDRGFSSRPVTLHEQPLELSRCTFCGTCVSMCPTGALSANNTLYTGTPESTHATICGFCGAGCSLSIGVSGGRGVEVNPAMDKDSVNRSTLCVRGHFANDFLHSPDRLTRPLIRKVDDEGNAIYEPVGFDDALSLAAETLADIKHRHGPDSIGFIGSAKCSNEENYLFQKIARVVFQTNNITTCDLSGNQRLLREAQEKTMGACRVNPLSNLEHAEAIIILFNDIDHTVPVAGYHIKRAAKKGAELMMIDSRRSELAVFGGTWLHPENRSGEDVFALDTINALSAHLIADNAADEAFIKDKTVDRHGWLEAISSKSPDTFAKNAGIPTETIKNAASLLKNKKIAFVLPCDLLERPYGSETLDAVINLALITGSIGFKNAGIFIPTLENNTAGALDMGCVPDMLPGWRPMENPDEKETVGGLWGTNIPDFPGKDIYGLIKAAEEGALKALYIMGENPLRSLPNPERVRAAMKKLDFIVVQDIIHNRTTRLADVILPAGAFAEKQGTFTNMEGRIQCFLPVVPPPGEALPDWTILAMLAQKAGYPEQHTAIESIRDEIRRVVPMYGDLGRHRRDWLKKKPLKDSDRFHLAPIHAPKAPDADENYPFTALIGSRRWHLGSGTRTSRSYRINASGNIGEIEVSPGDAKTLNGNSGAKTGGKSIIRLLSPFGAIEREFTVNPALPPGHVFVPHGFSGNDAMRLADLNALQAAGSAWRTIRVRIETT